ncbi:hypothetical protein CDIK_2142 [Cucumispora dikerogammari]|nr:hypothetical protein CDIK_2142 [Cucumispora dikerogammari]
MIYDSSPLLEGAEIQSNNLLFDKYKTCIEKIYPARTELTYQNEIKILKRNFKSILAQDILKTVVDNDIKNVLFYRMMMFFKQRTFFSFPYIEYKYGKLTYSTSGEIYEKSLKNRKNLLSEMSEGKLKKKMKRFGIDYIFEYLETSEAKPTSGIDELYSWEPSNVIRERGFWYIALHSVFPDFQAQLLARIKHQIIMVMRKKQSAKTLKECLERLPLYNFLSCHLSEFGLKNIEKFFNPLSDNKSSANFFTRKYVQNVEEMEPELNVVLLDFIFSNIDLYNLENNIQEEPTECPLLVISHDYWCECETYGIRGTKMEKNQKLKKTCQNFQKHNFLEAKTYTDYTKPDFWNYIEPSICIRYSTVSFSVETNKQQTLSFVDVPLVDYIGLLEKNPEFKDKWVERGVPWNERIKKM